MGDELYLIVPDSGTQNAIGVYVPPTTPTTRLVLGERSGISRSEWSAAGQAGHRPEFSFTLPTVDYGGEREALYGGKRYSIYRTYPVNGGWDVELYLEAKVGVTQ